MNKLRILALALVTLGTGACTTLAPDYQRPAAPVPAAWAYAPAAESGAAAAADIGWRDFLADERLRRVVELALEHNRDLRVAVLNIEQARAQYRIQRADQFPSLGLTASQNAQRVPGDLNTSGESMVSRQYGVSAGIASWELDFFGRVRSLRDAALEQYLASEEAHRSAHIALVTEVATAWLQVAADRERLDLARRTLETRRKAYDLTRASFEAGAVSALDLHQTRGEMESARADAAAFESSAARAENALALLTGRAVPAELLPAGLDVAATRLAELPAGTPADVLVSRPDIVAAEHRLRAANANIGAARAAFFPRITLTASTGTASAELGGLFEGGSRAWSFLPQLTLPIFEAGRLTANLDLAEVRRDITVAEYERAIQGAFREVADALAERATLGEQLDARRGLQAAALESHRLSEARYRAGVDSFLVLLDAQRTLYGAEQELIAARLADAANRVTVYKVLGGGWQ
ncbi:AdeC/AdeK/OprM family multidrug efflux complex outer membrane factor [Pseudothauera rhizosphaerae]|uniref:AdeC/AdeK/OprM family multidrug efflux complex outer membrane factor n=1 Tax=Pseudothauera rhizosphaerae TaxID=2565932 RepID=A0A4S4AQX9_9RHOO|nr:AdeC/AdeK/OprM family multidrug efflux complex outer membrane factor [Pseudothauera rhizosphaerae]THF62179.1 AdeC/AdeK/OprM family multidrug efflux complex outer membrane factor [Pseudothauera rhizosphaerae]